jgi:prepilin-type processing-associated H-X9-DG protein
MGANARMAALTSPVKTVMLFETMSPSTLSNVEQEHNLGYIQNSGFNTLGGMGWPGRLTSDANLANNNGYYATGMMGGGVGSRGAALIPRATAQANAFGNGGMIEGRHFEGANFLLADGHVKWYKGDQVSTSWMARNSTDAQGPNATDPRNSRAQGTEYEGAGAFAVTYSTR